MKHPCDHVRLRLLDGGGADDQALRQHLDACPECRSLAKAWEAFRDAPRAPRVDTPPEHVDFAVRREAVAVAEHRVHRQHALARGFSWAAIAACAAIVAGVVFSLLRTPPADAPGLPVVTAALAHPEDGAWRQVDLGEDFFILDAEIEITFAMLSQNNNPIGL
jgi:anti-sigma factor RsiW